MKISRKNISIYIKILSIIVKNIYILPEKPEKKPNKPKYNNASDAENAIYVAMKTARNRMKPISLHSITTIKSDRSRPLLKKQHNRSAHL